MDNLVADLRYIGEILRVHQQMFPVPEHIPQKIRVCNEAADEITRLRAEIATLKASIADEREDAARAMWTHCFEALTYHLTARQHIRNINPAQFRSRQS